MNLSNISKSIYFDDHQMVVAFFDVTTSLFGYLAIHRNYNNSPAFGATRLLDYDSDSKALEDALMLSRAMSYKAALAGLPVGGAKAVLISNPGISENKKSLLDSYAKRLNILSGKFITGSDVGISREDVISMRRISPYIVGTKVNPERFTGLGLFYSIRAVLRYIYGSPELRGRSFAIQGLGKVGSELLKLIYPYAETIFVSDINQLTLDITKKKYPNIVVVNNNSIHTKDVDIFSPCALRHCLRVDNYKDLKCRAIVGGANNQLDNDKTGKLIHSRGIIYAPDFIANSGGLISVYDEYEFDDTRVSRVIQKIKPIEETLLKIITKSTKYKSTSEVAYEVGEQIINKYEKRS